LGLLALLAPLAAAAGATGTLQVQGMVGLPGASTFDAPRADLAWNSSDVPALQIQGASFTVERIGESTSSTTTPLGAVNVVPPTQVHDTKTYGAGTLDLARGTGAQLVTLVARGPVGGNLTDATVRAVGGVPLAVILDNQYDPATGACNQGTDYCVDDHGVYELATLGTDGTFAGDAVLLLHGPTLQLHTDGADASVTTGSTSGSGAIPTTDDLWAIVHVTAAKGSVHATAPTAWYAPTPTLHAAGARVPLATGDVAVGLSSYRAASEAVDVAGTLELATDSAASGPWELAHGKVAYDDGFTMHVSGDVQSINLHARPVFVDAPAASGAGVLALAAAGAALAYYWPVVSFHLTAAALPLYTRLKQPEILANGVRNAIFEIIRANPGISAREVHRRSDQSWGTVVYHLRQLERHHLVVSRSVGRTRNYYENHGKYRGMEVQLACLQSARARALARIVLDAPGITQEELVAHSGFPQPTTSYYVRKLKGAALVEERRQGRYARYYAHVELSRLLGLAEHAPADEPTVAFTQAGVEG
jgi:DNA-binding transcriptional ArsR family regulator